MTVIEVNVNYLVVLVACDLAWGGGSFERGSRTSLPVAAVALAAPRL